MDMLPLPVINRVNAIFSAKGWHINADDEQYQFYKDLFSKFIVLLSKLNPLEQSLILDLTEDYFYNPVNKYWASINNLLPRLSAFASTDTKHIFFLPVIRRNDKGKTKSGNFLLYYLKSPDALQHAGLAGHNVVVYEDPNLLLEKHSNRGKSLIVLVDDFIGTGTYASDSIAYFNDNLKIKTDDVVIFALIALKMGLDRLSSFGYQIITEKIMSKAISESDKFDDIDTALRTMDDIERRLDIGKDYHRGFGQSEAIVTLIRTPNNTFPVFWCDKAKDGKSWPNPFSR